VNSLQILGRQESPFVGRERESDTRVVGWTRHELRDNKGLARALSDRLEAGGGWVRADQLHDGKNDTFDIKMFKNATISVAGPFHDLIEVIHPAYYFDPPSFCRAGGGATIQLPILIRIERVDRARRLATCAVSRVPLGGVCQPASVAHFDETSGAVLTLSAWARWSTAVLAGGLTWACLSSLGALA